VPDQISIAAPVYNLGGTVQVAAGDMLNLTGKDASGYSYWQKTGSTALLQLDNGANINAAGTYQIDIGTVKLTAPGGGRADELDGAGLNFGNANATSLTFVDAGVTPGTVTVQGPVTLAANTTTTLNFTGGSNTADLLDVKNGTLTLNGTLKLNSTDNKKPTAALNFLDDSGFGPSIAGNFTSITDSLNGTDVGAKVTNNPQLIYYQVTIS